MMHPWVSLLRILQSAAIRILPLHLRLFETVSRLPPYVPVDASSSVPRLCTPMHAFVVCAFSALGCVVVAVAWTRAWLSACSRRVVACVPSCWRALQCFLARVSGADRATRVSVLVLHVLKDGVCHVYVFARKRGEHSKACTGLWALPGGRFRGSADDDMRGCAVRGLEEATCLRVRPGRVLPVQVPPGGLAALSSCVHCPPDVVLTPFHVRLFDDEVPNVDGASSDVHSDCALLESDVLLLERGGAVLPSHDHLVVVWWANTCRMDESLCEADLRVLRGVGAPPAPAYPRGVPVRDVGCPGFPSACARRSAGSRPALSCGGAELLARAICVIGRCATAARVRPETVALVGVQGCGKSTTLRRLEAELGGAPCIPEDVRAFAGPLRALLRAMGAPACGGPPAGGGAPPTPGVCRSCNQPLDLNGCIGPSVPDTARCGAAPRLYPFSVRCLAAEVQLCVLAAHREVGVPSVRERAPTCGWVFCLVALVRGLLTFDEFRSICWAIVHRGYLPAGLVYVREPARVCKARAMRRVGREAEGSSPLAYFADLVLAHDIVLSLPAVQARLTFYRVLSAPPLVPRASGDSSLRAAWVEPIAAFLAAGVP